MNIIICGAGEVGFHTAEVFAALGRNITVIDANPDRLRRVEESLDVATITGNCARADVLTEAGAADADLVVAATNSDEVNLLTAAVGKGIGARKSIARVHHRAFFEQHGLAYQEHLGIDLLICPEYMTALAIARTLRNPGALAIEGFARGRIEMQEFPVSAKAPAIGKSLMDAPLPKGSRLVSITRKGGSFVPEATTVIEPDDIVILVGNHDVFQEARKIFRDKKHPRQRVIVMGGTSMSVWLCRALRDRNFAVRVFETDRARAEELANKLPWTTVIQADPTDRNTFDEEHIAEADVFVAMLDDDEANIIGGVLAKLRGVEKVIAVVQDTKYLDLIYDIGIDRAFSPRIVAAGQIDQLLDEAPLRQLASLSAGIVSVFQVRVGENAPTIGRALHQLDLSPQWVMAAIQRDAEAHVPGADDVIQRGDIVLVVGRQGEEATLKKMFAVK